MNRKEFLNIKDIDIFYRKENPEPQAILHATFNYNTTRLTLTDLIKSVTSGVVRK